MAAGSADGGSEEQDPEKAEAKPSGGEDGEESGEEGTEGPSADASDPESSQNGDGGLEMIPGVPGSPQQHQKVSDQEGGRIPLHDTSEVSAPEGGSTEHDDSYEGAGYTGPPPTLNGC